VSGADDHEADIVCKYLRPVFETTLLELDQVRQTAAAKPIFRYDQTTIGNG
jgi:hypothetical protein